MKMIKLLLMLTILLQTGVTYAKETDPTRKGLNQDSTLLTIILKHDQAKNVAEIGKILEEQEFFKHFPPKGTSVISWYVMMGIGQVVTLEVPAAKIRDVNLAVEKHGWKAYRSEFYSTYNLYPAIKDKLKNKSKKSL